MCFTRSRKHATPGDHSFSSTHLFFYFQIIYLLFFSAPTGVNCSDASMIDRECLLEKLINRDLFNLVRPVKDTSTATNITHEIALIQILDVNAKDQTISLNVWLRQYWKDEYLTWNKHDFNNIEEIRIPMSKIWQPDLTLYTSMDKSYERNYYTGDAVVKWDGHISAFQPAVITSSCNVDATRFPFDSQTCELKWGSWSYNAYFIDVYNASDSAETTNFIKNGEWSLIKMTSRREVEYYGNSTEPFSVVTYNLHIKRHALFYVMKIHLPCLLVSMLVLIGFYLPPDCGEKMSLSVTTVLTLIVLLGVISELLPPTASYVPRIQMYLFLTLGMVTLSCFFTALVINTHVPGANSKKRLPRWFKRLAFTFLCPFSKKKIYSRKFYKANGNENRSFKMRNFPGPVDNKVTQALESIAILGMAPKLLNGNENTADTNDINVSTPQASSSFHENSVRRAQYRSQKSDGQEYLEKMAARALAEEEEETIQLEWREAAKTVDRFLRVTFSIIIIILNAVFISGLL